MHTYVHLHVRTCVPLFGTSGTAGGTQKFDAWLETHQLCVLRYKFACSFADAPHPWFVCTPFPYLGDGWTHCPEVWCVTISYLFYTCYDWGISALPHGRIPLFHILGSTERIMLKYGALLDTLAFILHFILHSIE